MTRVTRRHFLGTTAAASAALLVPTMLWSGCTVQAEHPRLYVTHRKQDGLRSVAELQAAIQHGHAQAIWQGIQARADADLEAPPITPATPLPGRTPSAIQMRNPDYVVCDAAGQRVMRHALAHLITGEAMYGTAALAQIGTLFDATAWPQWLDQAHERFGHPAGLRTGMLARDVGLAYDWLYPALAPEERAFIEAGLDRYAITPFLTSLEQDPWWIHDLNNWVTTIAGGVSVAAMALGDAHPQSQEVLDRTVALLDAYLTRYGPDGEFNECPAYASATERPAMFYAALRYASGGGTNRLSAWPFPQTSYWVMYMTLPPGRIAALGDSKPDYKPWIRHFAAIAAATRDPVLQAYYLHHSDPEVADPLELLWYDATLDAISPEGRLPLGRAYAAHGACISSRTSWNFNETACVVYGKASREENHERNDDGQVCIDGYGERLIVDLGPPSGGYPDRFFDEDRWKYYNASVRGHNVLMIGGQERRHFFRNRGTDTEAQYQAIRGRLLDAAFEDARGGWWHVDLTPTYEGAERVHRTVVHLLPGIVAVLDDAVLAVEKTCTLRWHTAQPVVPTAQGAFTVDGQRARLTGYMARLDAPPIAFRQGRHAYVAPYDKNRDGDPLHQLRESYVETEVRAKQFHVLSLFVVSPVEAPAHAWHRTQEGYAIETAEGTVSVQVDAQRLSVRNETTGVAWEINTG